MNIEHFFYIYSAMTQATGAILALVGVFIIFKIQSQREFIDLNAERIRKLTFDPRSIDAYTRFFFDRDSKERIGVVYSPAS